MCGIVGIFRTSRSQQPIHTNVLLQMREAMVHRGPDDSGLYISPQQEIGLAHRRLSIIDLSSQASQPMSNEDESLWIVFNGEIYNHAELRALLIQEGVPFKTDHSDTEVILKGYQQWGEDILPRLRGMFAFVIWDKHKKKIWMVRDRMGVKPLYYTSTSGMFIFSSEIKSLLRYPGIKRECNDRAFYDFLTFLVSPAPRTLFGGIFKLPAAHTLTIFADGSQQLKRYWNPFSGVQRISSDPEEEWSHRILASLKESVRYRMVSDVKFGVFLSGGVDSSTNVALMNDLMNQPVETFSIGFEGPEEFNELKYARKVADHYKTNHHEVIIGPEHFKKFLPKLVYHQDEPIVDPVCVPVYFLSQLARENKTVVCQVGEGADELYCGYPSWGNSLRAQSWVRGFQQVPRAFRHRLYRGLSPLAPWKSGRIVDLFRRASFDERTFWGGAEAFQEFHKMRFLSPEFLQQMNGYNSYEIIRDFEREFEIDAPEGADDLHWMSYLDLRLRLPELLLMRVDKMTMAASVESRVPFLDQEFVSLAMSLPQNLKFKNKTLKYLLKKAVDPVLPREILNRPKRGFAVPVESWFQEKLRRWSDEKILKFVHRSPYFNRQFMDNYLPKTNAMRSWFLLNFVLWHEMWIEGKNPGDPQDLLNEVSARV